MDNSIERARDAQAGYPRSKMFFTIDKKKRRLVPLMTREPGDMTIKEAATYAKESEATMAQVWLASFGSIVGIDPEDEAPAAADAVDPQPTPTAPTAKSQFSREYNRHGDMLFCLLNDFLHPIPGRKSARIVTLEQAAFLANESVEKMQQYWEEDDGNPGIIPSRINDPRLDEMEPAPPKTKISYADFKPVNITDGADALEHIDAQRRGDNQVQPHPNTLVAMATLFNFVNNLQDVAEHLRRLSADSEFEVRYRDVAAHIDDAVNEARHFAGDLMRADREEWATEIEKIKNISY